MTNLVAIYALCDVSNPLRVRYVGKATKPINRFRQHLAQCKRGTSAKDGWIRDILAAGGGVASLLVEMVDPRAVTLAESYWVRRLRRQGHLLLNCDYIRSNKGEAYDSPTVFDVLSSQIITAGPGVMAKHQLARNRNIVRWGINEAA